MRQFILYTVGCLLLAACQNPQVQKPEWVNAVDTLSIPAEKMVFRASGKNWEAVLLTFTQPVALEVVYTNSGLVITQANKSGITEGPAHIVLKNRDQSFIYPVMILNKDSGAISKKDYRSPKTVNPDSSLAQQSLLHAMDPWRNLVRTPNLPEYFKEFMLGLTPKAGTFRAIEDEAVTAFYVQPGSCTSIPLQAQYYKEDHVYTVMAGPLLDAWGNTVANGTLVKFMYKVQHTTWQMESVLQNGYASVRIPAGKGERLSLVAAVQQTQSSTLILKPQ